jgi:hypothetical protein
MAVRPMRPVKVRLWPRRPDGDEGIEANTGPVQPVALLGRAWRYLPGRDLGRGWSCQGLGEDESYEFGRFFLAGNGMLYEVGR